MNSVLRSVRKRKKGRTLGAVDVIDQEEYAELEVNAKVELIRSLVPLGLMHIEELLDEEVTALAGERYARKAPSVGGRRHGSNPGTVGCQDPWIAPVMALARRAHAIHIGSALRGSGRRRRVRRRRRPSSGRPCGRSSTRRPA